ncbi:MAG TPA: pantoate kinase [Methanobacterium sp.]|nr:GHMP kinase [Methanobacterium sp.]HOI40031.1 pantoate kinase [Methanobacterium sp.]
MQSLVFAPSHITGFFEVVDHPDPLIKGSRGAGVTLDQGVLTQVDVSEGNGEIIIKNNGKPISPKYPLDTSVSYRTLDLLRKQTGTIEWNNIQITIHHQTQVPVESGFGVSAGYALGTAIGLSKLLKLPLTFNQAASIAHHAEVDLKTGLGDVIAALFGGFPIRVEPGAPGIGRVDKILNGDVNNSNDDLFVISKSLGNIETASVLQDPALTHKINGVARHMLQKLLSNPKITNFMDISLKFALETGLIDPEIMEIVDVMKDETLGASMAMLGKTAFAISETPDSSVEGVMVARVDNCGCRF